MFDVANLEVCDDNSTTYVFKTTRRFLFCKIPPKSEQNDYDQAIKYSAKSIHARWTCSTQFDLFFPEPAEAPHIVDYSQRNKEETLFDGTIEDYSPGEISGKMHD